MNYALIDNGVVANIICLHPMNAREFPEAVPFGDLPVQIGDTYVDGVFYHEGEKVLTAYESQLAEMEDMKAALANLGVSVDE